MKRIGLLILLVLSLQGCVAAIAGVAAASGYVVYDNRSVQVAYDDQLLESKLNNLIQGQRDIARISHINVAVFNGVVLLTGETPYAQDKQFVQKLIAKQPHVDTLYNEISVQQPLSTSVMASDTWISAKVKSQMLMTKGLSSGLVKVTTEGGNVYLMGKMTAEQADKAVAIARQVAGVKEVIKVMDIT